MFTPKFTITNKILTNISGIEAAREVITNAPLVPAWEAKFREEALVRMVHHNTHIEGNSLDQKEVAQVLLGSKVIGRSRDIQEVLNYRDVLKYIDSEYKKDDPITQDIVLKIHKLAVNKTLEDSGNAGSYRRVQVAVRNQTTSEISFMPPPYTQVPHLMNDFIFWLNHTTDDEFSPILKAGITHYTVNAIHPFVDGNGRTGRALATLILFRSGYDIKKFFSLEEYYDSDAARYYENLQKVSNQSKDLLQRDMTPWLEYFTEGLLIELKKIKDKVQRLSVDLKLKGKIGQVSLNERQIKMVEYMEEWGQISNKDWRALLPMVSDDTILRDLKDLIAKKLVKKKGSTKASQYILK